MTTASRWSRTFSRIHADEGEVELARVSDHLFDVVAEERLAAGEIKDVAVLADDPEDLLRLLDADLLVLHELVEVRGKMLAVGATEIAHAGDVVDRHHGIERVFAREVRRQDVLDVGARQVPVLQGNSPREGGSAGTVANVT
jgi:hypothetical protein